MTKFQPVVHTISLIVKTFQLVWTATHSWTVAWFFLLLIQGLLPGMTVYLTRTLVNNLVAGVGAGLSWHNVQPVLIPATLMAGILLLTEGLGSLTDWVRTAQSELVQDHISGLIHRQSIEIDFGCYESSHYNDQLNRAREGAGGRSLALLESLGSLLQNSITILIMAGLLIPYGFWLPGILLISAIPAFYVLVRLSQAQYDWSQRTTLDRRWLSYFELLVTNSGSAAEARLFDFGGYFQSAYQRLRSRLRREQLKIIQDQMIGRFIAGLLALVTTGAVLVWMGHQVLLGLLTLGDLALFYQAFNRGQGIIRSLLGSLGQIYRNTLFIGNLFEFLKIKPQIIDPPYPLPLPINLQQGIRFSKVTFRYPGCQEAILENFDLEIPAGKIVAIVGDNGSGKSTLMKLLCRLYDPESGGVEVDRVNIRLFPVKAFRQLLSVLPQNPLPYFMTAGENIALGNLSTSSNSNEIEASARASGIHDKLTSLPQGYNTMLGKWFPEGTDLSGGQWQRLALARAFFRKSPIIILDEPTSAMDPWAEFDWLERFRELAMGRTALVITHRFTLAMRADIIHVMKAGKIVESGTHAELLAQDGFYAQSWRSQMSSNAANSESESESESLEPCQGV